LRYLVLGDVTIVIDTSADLAMISDDGVNGTARAELVVRNTPGGYWIAASNPIAADHAPTGAVPITSVRRAAVLSDGAARAVDPFGLHDSPALLDLAEKCGPVAVLGEVRVAEASDPNGARWP
jgi:hypothetical protein